MGIILKTDTKDIITNYWITKNGQNTQKWVNKDTHFWAIMFKIGI